jgi:hypothetical protein
MDSSKIQNIETSELMNITRRMSTSGILQLHRTTLRPEWVALFLQLYANALKPDPFEWMMRGIEIKSEESLNNYGLLDLFRQTQKFEAYKEARESCKLALGKLSFLKQAQKLSGLTPGTPEFDMEYFFFDFMPWNYDQALMIHQGTIADAAGRGDLGFFKRLYNKVKNDQGKKAGGQYEYFLTAHWLHGFYWLMPEGFACEEVARRMRRLFEAGENEGFETRKSASEGKQDYDRSRSDWEKFKATLGEPEEHTKPQSDNKAQHEKQRNRFRKAVRSLGLYQHPESPVIGTRKPATDEPNTSCYVWKNGWPK